MNIPPDKQGRLADSDVKSLRGFRTLLDKTFKNNLAKGATVKSVNEINTAALLDGRYNTHFTTKGKDTTTIIEFTLPASKTFDVLSLQEDITVGQRIERFVLEYRNGSQWLKITEGSTVGYKRLLKFDPVSTNKIRLKIESSRLNPTLSEFGLYKLP